jgi:hypothetical protein
MRNDYPLIKSREVRFAPEGCCSQRMPRGAQFRAEQETHPQKILCVHRKQFTVNNILSSADGFLFLNHFKSFFSVR